MADNGIQKRHVTEDGTLHIVKQQNVDEMLKALHVLRSDHRHSRGIAGGRHIGSIPTVLAYQFMQECGAAVGTAEWSKYAARKLRSPEYAAFRVNK